MIGPFVRLSVALAAAAVGLLCNGCGRRDTGGAGGDPGVVKVAYLGLSCEAPIYVAVEKGMFAEQGLNVEIIKTDWDGLREGLATGHFHANHTLLMYVLKGLVKLSVSGRIEAVVGVLGSGNFFGEECLAGHAIRKRKHAWHARFAKIR